MASICIGLVGTRGEKNAIRKHCGNAPCGPKKALLQMCFWLGWTFAKSIQS